jgi:hypothetical protein
MSGVKLTNPDTNRDKLSGFTPAGRAWLAEKQQPTKGAKKK